MLKQSIAIAALYVAGTIGASAAVIDFEGFSSGDTVGTVGIATFSSSAPNVQAYTFPNYAQSGTQTIGGSGSSFFADIYVDFAVNVNDLSFYSGADNDNGKNFEVNVFQNGVFTATVDMFGDGNIFSEEFHDLSAFTNVSRIEIVNVTDGAGLVYDDFSFVPAAIPVPAAGILLLGGLGGLVAMRRRKTS